MTGTETSALAAIRSLTWNPHIRVCTKNLILADNLGPLPWKYTDISQMARARHI
jgi:hypothetical protein